MATSDALVVTHKLVCDERGRVIGIAKQLGQHLWCCRISRVRAFRASCEEAVDLIQEVSAILSSPL